MIKRLWGPFSIPGEREAGAERRGSGVWWFLWVKWPLGCARGERCYNLPQASPLLRQKLDGGGQSQAIGTLPLSGKADLHKRVHMPVPRPAQNLMWGPEY